jgi:hypothetical protein
MVPETTGCEGDTKIDLWREGGRMGQKNRGKRWLGGSSIANLAEWQRISTGKVLALLGLQEKTETLMG